MLVSAAAGNNCRALGTGGGGNGVLLRGIWCRVLASKLPYPAMRTVLLTSCTNRKKAVPLPGLSARELPFAGMAAVAATWARRVAEAMERLPAIDLYSGRSFSEARAAATEAGAPLYVLSAGLGVVAADAHVPSYALTVVQSSSDSVATRIAERMDPQQWWTHLTQAQRVPSPVAALVRQYPAHRIVIACSSAYVRMIEADLLSLPIEDLVRVRIIGPQASAEVPESLTALIMPYDARFDGPQGPNPGTRSDFPQRAARHFLSLALDDDPAAVAVDIGAVRSMLQAWARPPVVPRATRSDDEIRTLICAHWDRAGGSSARMLRVLRDDLQVSCEQKRFAQLFREIKQGAGRDG